MDFLTPARRKAIYAALAAVGVILVVAGLVNESLVTGVLGLADAVLALVALALASVKAKRADYTALYAAFAAVVVALKVLGVIDDGVSSHVLDVAAAVFGALPLLIAALRTDPTVPTGEPRTEYALAA